MNNKVLDRKYYIITILENIYIFIYNFFSIPGLYADSFTVHSEVTTHFEFWLNMISLVINEISSTMARFREN